MCASDVDFTSVSMIFLLYCGNVWFVLFFVFHMNILFSTAFGVPVVTVKFEDDSHFLVYSCVDVIPDMPEVLGKNIIHLLFD